MAVRLSHNIVANAAGKAWNVVIALAVVPIYVKLLGIEGYGLIGVFVTLMAIAPLLDLGLGTAFTRAVAKGASGRDAGDALRDTLRTFEVVYCALGLAAGVAVAALAPALARGWVQPQTLSIETVERALATAGFAIACIWPRALYSAGVVGLQRQVALNALSSTMTTLQNVGGVLVVWQLGTVESLFVWAGVVGVIESVLTRALLKASLPAGSPRRAKIDFAIVGEMRHFAAGVAGISVLSVVLTQLDKIILSKVLTLEQFGCYSLAWRLANGLLLIVGPITNALYPRFTQLAQERSARELVRIYHAGSQLLAVLVIPAAVVIAVYASEVLELWTRDVSLARNTGAILALLAIGTGLNGLMGLPYVLQLAHGSTRPVVIANAVAVVVLAPVMYLSALRYGAVGPAASWIALNVGYLALLLRFMHRAVLPHELRPWLVADVGPVLAAATGAAVAWRLATGEQDSYMAMLLQVGAGAALTVLVSALTAPHVRSALVQRFRRPARTA